MDTDRYRRWVTMLTASETVLVQLALLALAAVIAWERLRSLPEPLRGWLRLLLMAAALGFLMVQLVTTRGMLIVFVSVLVVSVVARAVWAYRRRRSAGPRAMAQQEN